jgi:hypothetical protein
MTNSQVFRISGVALLAGAVVFVVHIVLRSVITAGPDPAAFAKEDQWVSVNVLGIMGAFLVILGLPAMYARMAGAAGLSGLIGVTLLAISWMFFGLFLSLYSTLVLPWLADKAPALIAASTPPPPAFMIGFVIGLLAWLAGTVLLAIPFIRRRAQPSWVGYLLAASGLWVVIGNVFIAPSGPASNLAVNLLSNMGPVLLMVGLGYLGYCLWSERDGCLHS